MVIKILTIKLQDSEFIFYGVFQTNCKTKNFEFPVNMSSSKKAKKNQLQSSKQAKIGKEVNKKKRLN